MSDKLRPGVAVTPEFVDGETPPAAKLNSISVQMKNAAEQLEGAVGDIHSQSWPYSATNLTTLSPKYNKHRTAGTELTGTVERTLDIANIARLIGPASNMNARSLHGKEITENVAVGLYEFPLRFIPDDNTAAGTVFSDTVVYATGFSVPSLMKTAGDYHVSALGNVYSVSASNGGTVVYNTTPSNYGGGMNASTARFNVMPDPNQIASGGAGLSFGAPDPQGRRTATLPVATHAQSNWEGTSVTLGTDDIIEGLQLRLPYVLTSNFTAGEEIPPGYLYIKNETTNEVYENATYYYDTLKTFLVLEDSLTADITAGHAFSVMTVGNDITSAIDDLRVKSYHSHDRKFGEPFIDIDSISGFIKDAGATGAWVPSEIPGNFAPQYLHRDGYIVGEDDNLNDGNAMRGDLLLGGSAVPGSADVYSNANSHKLLFGSTTRAIYAAGGDLRIETPSIVDNDIVIGRTASGVGNGGRVWLERGLGAEESKGNVATDACRPVFGSGFISTSGVLASFDISAIVPVGSDVFGWDVLIDPADDGNWFGPNSAVTGADYTVFLENDGVNMRFVYSENDMGTTGLRPMRYILWYKN